MHHTTATSHLPLCLPAGWAALWHRMAANSCLNA